MNNFRKFGFEKKAIILLAFDGDININALKFAKNTDAKVYFYADRRKNKKYIPSIRPHILKQFFEEHRIMDRWMYHDSDIIFTERPDFSSLDVDYDCVFVSDSGTRSYLDSQYIKSKSEVLFVQMCDKVGIDYSFVESQDSNVGGAQYLFNFVPSSLFWNKIERDCNTLWELMTEGDYGSQIKNGTIPHPIQAWTADMWAVLWNIWLGSSVTRVSRELDFCWPMEPIANKKKIFHNAGVDGSQKDLFYKAAFIDKSPFGVNFENVNPRSCSRLYVDEIKDTCVNLQR